MSSRNARAACDVRVTRDARQWLVCLDGNVVACFAVMGDALDYASLLECSPRARADAFR